MGTIQKFIETLKESIALKKKYFAYINYVGDLIIIPERNIQSKLIQTEDMLKNPIYSTLFNTSNFCFADSLEEIENTLIKKDKYEINDYTLKTIENIFNIKLTEDQKEYLKGNITTIQGDRGNGKTFAYILKMILTKGEPIKTIDLRMGFYSDESRKNKDYNKLFYKSFLDIYDKLFKAIVIDKVNLNIRELRGVL